MINKYIKNFLVSFVFLVGSISFAQDRCSTAVNLGTLPSPAACGVTNSGTIFTYNGTTIGATAENPYSSLTCMNSPAADVWVRFVAPAQGNELNINFTSALNTANIGLYTSTGGCNTLTGVLCENNATGNITASLGALTPGTTYYMQISGQDETDFSNFQLQLSVTNNCDLCVLGSNLTINPTPVGGFYLPGTTVDVCLEVTEYEQIGANWLAGVVPDFGPGWNAATLVGVSAPPGTGTYEWFYGNGPNGQGWYVDEDDFPGGFDGDFTNNFGDPSIDGTGTWTFCFRITTVNSCTPNLDLSINFDTLSDFETGGYGTAGCVGDPSFPFFAEMQCCNIPLTTSVNASCLALGSATVQGQSGVSPYDYVWENSLGTVIYTNNNNAGVSSLGGLAPGIYTVTVTDNVGCVQIVDITIAGAASNTVSAASSSPTICVNSLMPNITHTTTIATGISNNGVSGANGLPAGVSATWSAGVITISGTPTATGTFNYSIPLTGGCGIVSATGTIIVNPSPTLTSITSTTPICSGNNAVYNLTGTPNAIVSYNINGGASQTVTLNAGGTATVTVPSVTANTILNATNIAAAGTTITGNASSASGGINPANATGAISASGTAATVANCAAIDNANNTLTITLQHLVPAGTVITISIARDNNQGNVNISDGTANIGAFAAGPNDILQHITVTTTVATNTIVITRNNGTTWIDGVQYSFVLPGCSTTLTMSNTVVVILQNTIAAGVNRTTCINSAITNITLATTGATGATFAGLPAGVTGSWAANVATISGTPTASGIFNYTVTTTGGCPPATTTGTITVTPLNTIASGTSQTVCVNSAITNITLATTGATGATFAGLPAGVTGSWAGNVATISGTPTASGTFNYTVTTTGGCPPATTTGTIIVTPLNTIASGTSQTVCINSAITNITLATTGATGATFAGLPAGVTGSWAANVATISGTPTASGIFNYTVTTTGGCPPATTTGTITVTPQNTIASGTSQTVCINSAITNITLATTGATGATFAGLPAGVTGSWAANVATISGTPTASGIFNYTVTTTGGCPPATTTGTITVTPLNTIASGTSQTVCINSAITNITLATTGATGATFSGLPAGVTGSWAGNVATISGTPTASGIFNYTVTTTGGCPPATTTGTITVTPLNTIASGTSQTVCINSAITNITLATTGATGATFAGLPAGVTGSWAGNVATISGTPTASGIFNYTVTTTGGCPPATTTGTITVTPLNTIASGTSQTVCVNSAITNITLATTGATGATFAGLPAGVTGSWAGNVATISGTPTASGTFNYTVTTTGGCPPATTTGTITVTPLNTIASGTSQTVCINSAITNITLATTGATGATFAGLPAGVTGSWAGNVATISGTPTASGIFNYTVTTTGGCPPATTTGTITVTPLNTIASGTSQTVCINNAITNITLATTGATGATFAGLPVGVTGSFAAGVFTISGTPTASGIFNYTVTTTGGCSPAATTTGTITVTPLNTIASGTSQTVCINSAITNITLATTGATGATFAGLPAGVTGSWAANVATISGTPTASGIFNYTVTTTGGCPPATTTGTITVTPLNTIASGTSQTVCINSAITNITLATTGATGATFAGLPAGVTGSWAGNVATISGIPTASGIFNYTVTTTGGCPPATTTGTINVNPTAVPVTGFSYSTPVCINGTNPIPTTVPGFTTGGNYSSPGLSINTSTGEINLALSTAGTYTVTYFYGATACGAAGSSTFDITITPLPLISLTSVATTTNQTLCINTPVTNINYAVTNATGAIVSGLPVGVTGSFAAGVFTISGTPTASGIFNYTVTTTGGCSPAATTTGTITVTPQNTIASGTSQTVCINSAITNITLATTGATGATFSGLPAGVTGSWAGNVATISGTPTASGIFNYTVTTTGGCPPATTTGTITVTPLNTIASGTSQTVCINSAITNITLATTGATGATFAGLPAGVTGSWAANVATISGTPTASGIFNYTVTTTGGCPPAATTGTITVTPLNTIASGTSQTVCINSAITNITLATTGATGATFAGLPAGVTGSWAANVATISGTPTASGIFNYTVTTTGGCPPATTTGTITVTPLNTIASGTSQTVCINSAITNITLATTGATGATFAGLPAGVTGSWEGNVATISGTPTASGIFNYAVTTTGGCPPATTTGTITVTPLNTIAAGINRTTCINTAITNITLATTGATGATFSGLPAGVTVSWAANVATISGTPTASGTFNYTVTTTGGCPPATTTGTITVTPLNTIASGTSQTVCINSAITNITLATTGATGATFSGLPAGVTGSWAANVATISGTPTASGIFNYTVTTTGGCPPATTTGTITVTPLNTIASGTSQTVCINSAITNITLATTGATGATFAGLPAGVTGSWAANVATISGTPTASGIFNYTVTTTGGCPPATTTGTITVTPQNTIVSGTSQTVCINNAITNITLATTGATGATFAGLPAGVTGSWAGNVATISGTPSASGTFNYTVTTTGGCPPATTTGTITVTPLNTIASGTSQTVCVNSAITNITLATTGATGATFAGLPVGVTGSWAGNVATISGTPTASGIFNYTVTTTGGCPPAATTGTITVTPLNTIASGTSQTVCINSAITNITLATTGATGATFAGLPVGVTGSWAANVATISGTPTASGIFNYTVTTTGGCPPATTTGTITVNVPNTATISYPQPQYCVTESPISVVLTGTGNFTGGQFSSIPLGLSINQNTGVITPSTSTPNNYQINYLVPANGACPAYFVTTNIIITPLPTITNVAFSSNICSGSSTDIVLTSDVINTTYTWSATISNITGSYVTSGNETNINQIATLTDSENIGTITMVIIPRANGCDGAPRTILITVNPNPVIESVTVADSSVCSATNATNNVHVDIVGNISGITYTWTAITNGVTVVGGVTSGTITATSTTAAFDLQVITSDPLVAGTIYFEVSSVRNGCPGNTLQSGVVTVNPNPGLPIPSPIKTICSGEDTDLIVDVSPLIAGTELTWEVLTVVNVSGATPGTGIAPVTINDALTATTNTQGYVIYRVRSSLGECQGGYTDYRVNVNPAPLPKLVDGNICITATGEVYQTYTLNTGLNDADYDFEWFDTNGDIIPGATSSTLVVDEAGTYSVIATNWLTGCSSDPLLASATATVTETLPATSMTIIQSEYFSDNATITVNVTGGSGTLMYSLDEGPLQSSNVFTGVSAGEHLVTVVDTEGCTFMTQLVTIIDYPNYFTPNGDGINDTWNISGLNQPGAKLYIFDRYGKLVKQLSATDDSEGWDGTYNQELLPATDYWFSLDYMENGVAKQFKAHFSLIR